MKKLLRLSKMLLVAVGLLAGVNEAWADAITLYERGTTNAWSDADLTDWSGTTANTEYKIDGGLYIGNTAPGTNKISFSSGKTIAPTENSIVTMTAVVSMGMAANRNSSYDYLKIGGAELRVYGTGGTSSACISQVYIDGVAQGEAVSGTRGGTYTFNLEINQATKAVKYSVTGGSTIAETTTTTSNSIENVVIGHSRGGSEGGAGHHICLSKINISEVTQVVKKVAYTINYIYNDKNIKTTTDNIAVGATVYAESPIVIEGVRYYAKDGVKTEMDIVDGENVLNVDLRQAKSYSYTVKAVDGSDNDLFSIATGSYTEGDAAVSVAYPRFYLSGTTLLSSGSGSITYAVSFTPDADDYVQKVAYNSDPVADVAFFTEGEDVSEASVGANVRASKGQMGHTGGAETYLAVTTLVPGKYVLYMRSQNGNKDERKFNFKVGDDVVMTGSFAQGTNTDANSKEFTVFASSTLSFASEGSSASGVDYVYLVKTGEATVSAEIGEEGWATLYTDKALDFSGVEGLTAYTAELEGSTVTLTQVDNVPANTGVVLKGTAETYSIPVIASSTTAQGDLQGSATATAFNAFTGYDLYMLAKNGSEAQFKKVSSGSIPAGKAFLKVANGGAPALGIVFGDATGIEAVKKAETMATGEYYNLAGQRVAQPTKGLYIINGKKVVVK